MEATLTSIVGSGCDDVRRYKHAASRSLKRSPQGSRYAQALAPWRSRHHFDGVYPLQDDDDLPLHKLRAPRLACKLRWHLEEDGFR